ncbi:UBC-like protein [Tilletiaria anomala UBC 951]|uniref:Ubiquitin-conjugating enzyme E2 6 n=1 Tax=Tilletiaria anomala (strain ATCC 24038 / CBS 436.72 / UBC 951) TaxID=1037660 RepID=A0A066W5E3_TILAU|nr:UBC-like protein [Tilletiaria anomala UBC 951]KDN46289.1 UBC-like protein [Tilletiaria anomala UBC 951]
MATKAASKRLGKEQQIMEKDPPPYCYARPREDNVLEWHFILRGPPDSPYDGGEFWGQLSFPSDYPFKPPGIKMSTPSGRFKPDTKICTSMSDFHPGSWNPSWSVANILVGLLSFMCADEMTTGSVSASHADRQQFARQSHEWNIKQKKFRALFPDFSDATIKDLPNMGQRPAPPAAPPADKGAAAAGAEPESSRKAS